jgi:hypothetical protein
MRKLTRDNPAAVASIVKNWVNGEAPAERTIPNKPCHKTTDSKMPRSC